MKNKITMDNKQLTLDLQLSKAFTPMNGFPSEEVSNILSFPKKADPRFEFRARILEDLIRNKVVLE